MGEVDLVAEARSLILTVGIMLAMLYGWKRNNAAKIGRNLFLPAAIALVVAEIAGLQYIVISRFPVGVLHAVQWVLVALTMWFAVNLFYVERWGPDDG